MATAVRTSTNAASEAWKLMFALAKRKHSLLTASFADLDLTPAQAHALRLLRPDEPMAMSDLAGALYCHASNVTGLVDRLEARGLVERRPDPSDRRVKALALTEAGVGVRDRVVEAMATPPPELAALPAGDQRALLAILRRASPE